MKIERCIMERLTPRTCEMNEAIEGFACNKTVFLLKAKMQDDKETETWTIMNFEHDRFGLINGVLYLLKTRDKQYYDFFFTNHKNHEVWFYRFDPNMSFTEISRDIDILYMPISVEYR